MAEFEAQGHLYRTRKLNTFDQLFVIKRLSGAVKSALTPDLIKLLQQEHGKKNIENPYQFFGAILDAASKMPDADFEWIINTCYKAALRADDNKVKGQHVWHPLMSAGGQHMFQDIGPLEAVQICYQVLEENLGSFFGGLRSLFPDQGMETEEADQA